MQDQADATSWQAGPAVDLTWQPHVSAFWGAMFSDLQAGVGKPPLKYGWNCIARKQVSHSSANL